MLKIVGIEWHRAGSSGIDEVGRNLEARSSKLEARRKASIRNSNFEIRASSFEIPFFSLSPSDPPRSRSIPLDVDDPMPHS
jgi:hypothetical protein